MKKSWLEGAVEKVTSRVAKKAGDLAADQAKKQAVARVEDLKTSAKQALDKVEEALFGPDSESPEPAEETREARRRTVATPAETPSARAKAAAGGEGGALKRAREDADRRADARVEADAARARAEKKAIDDELAAMKRRLGKK